MKTTTTLLGGAMAALAVFVTSPAFADSAYATRNINVRSGPGLTYGIVDQLTAEEPVDRGDCNSDGTWCYVRHDGENGWVANAYLSTTAPGQQQDSSQEMSDEPDYRATSQLNIRTGPSTDFAVVDRLETNEKVRRGQCTSDGEWCYVSHDGADGWVASRFLSALRTTTPPSVDEDANSAPRVATAAVNVRTGPNTSFDAVDRLQRGERVQMTQCTATGAWCYITHDGPDGWVAARFLRPLDAPVSGNQSPSTPSLPQTTTQQIGTAIAGMPVRGAPSLFTSTVGHLDRGDTVEVESCSSDGYWCHVLSDNLDGWVPSAFLTIEEVTVNTPVASNTAVLARTTPIRRQPGGQSAILGMLQTGTPVSVHQCGPAGNYCQVTRNQLTGWVAADALKAPDNTQTPQAPEPNPANSVCFTGFGGIEICLNN